MGHRGNFVGFYLFAGICCPLIGIGITLAASRGYATGLVFAVSYATGMALIIVVPGVIAAGVATFMRLPVGHVAGGALTAASATFVAMAMWVAYALSHSTLN